jgi:hypothetical protein
VRPIPWQAKDASGKSNWLMDTLIGRPVATLIATAYADSLSGSIKMTLSMI